MNTAKDFCHHCGQPLKEGDLYYGDYAKAHAAGCIKVTASPDFKMTLARSDEDPPFSYARHFPPPWRKP